MCHKNIDSLKRKKISLVSFFISFCLISCSTSGTDKNPYTAEIALAYENAKSDYVREILSDGKITQEEMRDAQEKNIRCLEGAGIEARYVDDGGYGYESLEIIEGGQDLLAEYECFQKWIGDIEWIYVDQIINPQNADFDALVAACLAREGIVAENFTASDYREWVLQNSQHISANIDDGAKVKSFTVEATGEKFLPGGVSTFDPRVSMCQINPSR